MAAGPPPMTKMAIFVGAALVAARPDRGQPQGLPYAYQAKAFFTSKGLGFVHADCPDQARPGLLAPGYINQ